MMDGVSVLAPLVSAMSFGGAIALIWRRRPTPYALTWSTAFWALALGWTIVLIQGGSSTEVGAAPRLCWLAVILLFVHGLRQRAGRRPRGDVLAAIWGAISFATNVLAGIVPQDDALAAAMLPLLLAIGTVLAAVAVGPRAILSKAPRSLKVEWCALLLLGSYALVNLAHAGWVIAGDGDTSAGRAVILVATLGTIAIGLGALLVLNADLLTALERLARTDPLTNIWNRRGFDEAARHLLATRQAGSPAAAVVIADIDAFKSINDRHGHAMGDAVLVRFADMLKIAVQPGDLLARLGGEEFALLAFCVDGPGLAARMERVRAAMADLSQDHGPPLPVTASFGVAELGQGDQALRDALERADKALYRAKSEGRDRTILGMPPLRS